MDGLVSRLTGRPQHPSSGEPNPSSGSAAHTEHPHPDDDAMGRRRKTGSAAAAEADRLADALQSLSLGARRGAEECIVAALECVAELGRFGVRFATMC
jgi:hypothetical protein